MVSLDDEYNEVELDEKAGDELTHEPIDQWVTRQRFSDTSEVKIPERLVDQVIGQLTSGVLDLVACQNCEAEFTIIRGGKKQVSGVSIINQWCPECGGIHTAIKKKLLAGIVPLRLTLLAGELTEIASAAPSLYWIDQEDRSISFGERL